MSSRWPSVRLEDACVRVTDGTHQSPRFETHGIPFLVISDVTSGEIDWSGVSKWVNEETYEANTSRWRPERGDVLYTAVGSFGVAVPVETDQRFMFQRHIAHIKPDPRRVHTRFLAHILNSPTIRAIAEHVAKGVAQRTVTLGDLKNFEIPLPPIAEQRHIADILDKADAIRRKRKEAIALTEELLRSAFLEMFGDPVTNPKGWPVYSVDELCETKQYGTAEKANEGRDGLPVLRMNNLTYSGEIDLTALKWVPLAEKERVKLDLRDGDVLFNRVNSLELVGKTAVWHHGDGYTFAGYLIRLRFGEAAVGDYVSAAMNMPSMKRTLMSIAKPSINMANISGSDLARVKVPAPPIALQRRYRDFRRRVYEWRGDLNQHAAEAADLFNSLVARAFSGELEPSR